MEKRRRKEQKKSKKFDRKHALSIDTKRNLKFLGIDNCISIYLSPETQRYIGCRIGEEITAERPWVYVKKERIEDNLFLHENSSDFIALRTIIDEYPEDTILIGCYRTNQQKIEEFMICTTIQAKLEILELLAKEKEALVERVKALIYCQANPWRSLGSEEEVNGQLNVNNRHLIEIVIQSKNPITIGFGTVKFKYRLASVNPKFRSYDEVLPDRRFYKTLIFKIRIDRASQISPAQYHIKCQTILPYPKNKYTQTDEVFSVLQLTESQDVQLNNGLNRLQKFMEDSLLVNFHINLYNNDYDFPNSYKKSYARDPKELMNFQDVINCKDLYCGSISWNALISGLIAVSYVKRPLKLIENENCAILDEKKSRPKSLHDDKMILVWCYSDNLAAKLFIHVHFEITSINFCPYDENILVGGGSNGQIVIWDLRNKLKEVETKEYLSTTEQNHRNILRTHTTWIKWPPDVRHVFPSIISDITMSHKSPVVSIQWLPSYHRMTKLGYVENMGMVGGDPRLTYLEPTKSYQFLTCSIEDSCVLAWEIKQSAHMLKPDPATKKKHGRLSRLPGSLIDGISPLKKYNKHFIPFFRIKLEDPREKDKQIVVTDLILNNPKIDYVALNPGTLGNIRERTIFRDVTPMVIKPHLQTFVACSISGCVTKCVWKENDFDQGQVVNELTCDVNDFWAIHDGPILSCRSNMYYPECVLTVGGSVFGIWMMSANKKPIFWRKGACRYMSGLWSLNYPLLCLILREDNYLEFWDLGDYTSKPMRRTKLKGSQIMDVLADSSRAHVRKKTFLLTDMKGGIKVQDLPIFNTIRKSKEEIVAISEYVLNNMLLRKQHIENLNKRLKKKYILSRMYLFQRPEPAESKIPNTNAVKSEIIVRKHKVCEKQSRATKWQRKEEIRMYETLLQQKRIDIDELKQNTIPLMEKLNDRLEQQKKIDEKLALKEIIYDNQKKSLLDASLNVPRRKITVSFPKEMEAIIKQQYLEDYKLIEKETLESISRATNRITISWGAVLGKRKCEAIMDVNKRSIQSNNGTSDPVNYLRRNTRSRIAFKNIKR